LFFCPEDAGKIGGEREDADEETEHEEFVRFL
jgi:hypothetical protein